MAASQDNIVKSVCRNYPWASPAYVDQMYFDSRDHNGLIYWYDDIAGQHKDAEAAGRKK